MKKLYQILQNREYLFISVLSILPLLAKSRIIELFEKTEEFKNYISQYPSTSLSLDIVTALVYLLMIFQLLYRWKNKVIVDNIRVLLLIVLCFWYAVARFSLEWKFSPTYNFQSLYYTDLLIVITYFNCILLTRNYFDAYILLKFKPLLARAKNQEGFILESNGDQDLLGRKSYAKNISKTILKSRIDKQESCAIGITSSWGSGKSFFLDEIKKNLKNNDCIIIDFNPWKNHNSKNLINNFFDTFNNALSEYNPKLSSQIRQYANQLAEAEDNTYTKALDFLFQLVYGKKSVDELYDTINSTINKIDKKIIVFIDDLDRLDGNEILEIFKLVRTSSNFENTVFVVAFDKEYILSVLSSQYTDFRANFLEKIFIAEFCLPDFESEIIYEELEGRLLDALDERYHNLVKEYFTYQEDYVNNILKKCIISIRDVVRFPNVFKVNFNHIANQVSFYDILNLELIRYKYPSIHNFIRKNIKNIQDSDKFYFFKIDHVSTKRLWDQDDNLKKLDINLIFALFDNPINRDSVHTPFANKSKDLSLNENSSLGIRSYSNYQTYFTLRLIEKAIDEVEFQAIKLAKTEHFLDKIESWSQMSEITLESLVTKLYSVSKFSSQLEYKNILRGLYFLVEKFYTNNYSSPDTSNFFNFQKYFLDYTNSIFLI
ncbi:P-loop NTPase fold protein [Flectobacillus sp. BAB-3569]|uniref:KAP family P-loop NTPase fold protein n=1 Tax=Flectobacillus sp. BAB-3569 TaxID=1509483 RepID=UPI000BA4DB9E|nr:P-loop NTPase fold protein [Flectobacillus sp. BAB-3569]PAC29253.1 hypothetical protein BWI92_16625 [Flectobacillus sp. BAB-3569]